MALSGLFRHIHKELRLFARRNIKKDAPRLIDSPSTNTTGITASASMDFPHGIKIPRDYPKIAIYKLTLTNFQNKLNTKSKQLTNCR